MEASLTEADGLAGWIGLLAELAGRAGWLGWACQIGLAEVANRPLLLATAGLWSGGFPKYTKIFFVNFVYFEYFGNPSKPFARKSPEADGLAGWTGLLAELAGRAG